MPRKLVAITEDEYYPFYSIEEDPKHFHEYPKVLLPYSLVRRYNRNLEELHKVQDLLEKYLNKAILEEKGK